MTEKEEMSNDNFEEKDRVSLWWHVPCMCCLSIWSQTASKDNIGLSVHLRGSEKSLPCEGPKHKFTTHGFYSFRVIFLYLTLTKTKHSYFKLRLHRTHPSYTIICCLFEAQI